jgi:peptidoglycan/LPS O-acetylase OafA/YrhL
LIVTQVNNNVPAYQYDYDWVLFLTLVVFVVTLLLVIISTVSTQNKGISMFSIKESRKVFKINPNSNLNVLNGIRSISMIWVVFGHSMSYTISGAINIASSAETISLLKPFFLIVEGGLFAVDVFFFVAGILLAYVFLRTDNINSTTYPMAFIQRVLRFWPSYLIAIMIYYSVYLHLGSGPRWGSDG